MKLHRCTGVELEYKGERESLCCYTKMKRLKYCIHFVLVTLLLEAYIANANATWECKDLEVRVSGESVTFPATGLGHGVRCIYKGLEMGKGDHYFELKVGNTGGSVKVGVATEDGSKQYFYDKHLFNGCEMPLNRYFGDIVNPDLFNPTAYQTVGVIVRINREAMWLYLLHDGVSLGLAFKIFNPPTPLFPAILAGKQATVTFTKKSYEQPTMGDKLERSKQMLNNIYSLTSVTEGGKTKYECLNKQIRLRPSLPKQLQKDVNQDSIDVYLSLVYGTADDNIEGTLHIENQKWSFMESPKNDCMTFLKSVLTNIASFQFNNGIITVQSKDGKSFVAKQSVFPPVDCYNQ